MSESRDGAWAPPAFTLARVSRGGPRREANASKAALSDSPPQASGHVGPRSWRRISRALCPRGRVFARCVVLAPGVRWCRRAAAQRAGPNGQPRARRLAWEQRVEGTPVGSGLMGWRAPGRAGLSWPRVCGLRESRVGTVCVVRVAVGRLLLVLVALCGVACWLPAASLAQVSWSTPAAIDDNGHQPGRGCLPDRHPVHRRRRRWAAGDV
jgi:hypothetical protein